MKKLLLLSSIALTAVLSASHVAAEGEDNPTGVAGIYNGNVTSGGSYDPYTGNAMRVVDDLAVPGSVSKYPLKWTRTWNSRGAEAGWGGSWNFSYGYSMDSYSLIAGFPDGRRINCWDQCPSGIEEQIGADGNLTLADGGRVIFGSYTSSAGVTYHAPIQLIDPYGQITTYTYELDSSGNPTRLSRITEPGGRYLLVTWTGSVGIDSRVLSVQAFDGRGYMMDSVTYSYTTLGNPPAQMISRADYANGTSATYTYEMDGGTPPNNHPRLVTCDDVRHNGPMRQIKYDYGTSHTHIKSEKNFVTGEALTTRTNPTGNQFTETRGDGKIRNFKYGGGNSGPDKGKLEWYTDFEGHTTNIAYDASPYTSYAFISSVTDANGYTTTYTRSTPQNLFTWGIHKITHPDGSYISQTFTDDANPYYLASRTDEFGHTTTYTRDANMRITRKDYADGCYETFTYNSLGEVLTHRMTNGGTESLTYDYRGLKTTATDALGNITSYTYYAPGSANFPAWADRLKTVTHPANVSGYHETETFEYDRTFVSGADTGTAVAARGLVTKVTHTDGSYQTSTHDIYGNILSSTDELGHTTSHTYDAYKRVLTTTDPLTHVVTNSYIPTGYTSSNITTSSSPFTITLPSGKKVNTYYDGNWRKTRVQQAPGTGDEANSYFTYDPVGNVLTTKDPRNNVTTNVYDNRDRLTSVSDPLNHTTSFTYDAMNKKTETHANGELITYDIYDQMNRLTQKTVHRDGSNLDVTTMSYDCAGNLLTFTDENSHSYVYTYDVLSRRTNLVYPNALQEVTHYDSAGNVDYAINRNGKTQTFTYDNRNRATGFSWNDSGVTPSQTMAYDAASRGTQVANSISTINHVYLNDNRLSTEEEWTNQFSDNVHRIVTYTYDVDGNRLTTQYPSGTAFNYTYTNRNQAASIKPGLSGGTAIASYVYDASGNITSRTLDNGTSTAYTVDTVNRDTIITATMVGSTKRFDYGYNTVNDITVVQRDSNLGDGFNYDLTQQTTEYRQNGTVNWGTGTVTAGTDNNLQFDGCGNRTVLNATPQAYNNMNQPTGGTFNYDNEGCLLSYNGWTYTYDAQNRLTNVTNVPNGTTTAQFYYDGKNRQIARSINGAPPTFSVWDDWELIEEYGTGNVRTAAYLQGAHGPVKSLVGNVYYFYQDELGSTSHIADATGHLLEYYKYNLYGAPTYWSPSNSQLSSSAYNIRDLFSGERYVPELGLYDLRNRFMSPDLGRFLQPDPIGFKGDASNLYRYCGNDWANRTDPMGLEADAYLVREDYYIHTNEPAETAARRAPGTWTVVENGKRITVSKANENGFYSNRRGVAAGEYMLKPKEHAGNFPAGQPAITGTQPGLKPGQADRSYPEGSALVHEKGQTRPDSKGCITVSPQAEKLTKEVMDRNLNDGGTHVHVTNGHQLTSDHEVRRAEPVTGNPPPPPPPPPQASNAEPGSNAADGMGLAFIGQGPKPGPAQ